jgi:L-asparaginase / beta-aspartyl-peptidase
LRQLSKITSMATLAIVVHGGAGPDSQKIKKNIAGYRKGLEQAVLTGYKVLEEGGSALDAVEAAVNVLEDDHLFNAGRGSALNEKGEVEMDASIVDGSNLKSGAVAIVRNVKNPVTLARAVMEKTKHIYLGDMGALELAKKLNLRLEPSSYFITTEAYDEYAEAREEEGGDAQAVAREQLARRVSHGTVGAVALDSRGNIAAATSSGGTECKSEGRISDSSIPGIGSYADNKTCAVSSTGDGEYLIQHNMAFHISALMEYKGLSLQEACRYLFHEKLKDVEGDMGIIALDTQGNIAMEFNSDRMHRGWKVGAGEVRTEIYQPF